MNPSRFILGLIAAASLSGCAALDQATQRASRVERDHQAAAAIVKSSVEQRQQTGRDTVAFHDGNWTSLVPIEIKQREARARLLCKGDPRLSYSPRSPVDILEFSQFVTNLCGVPIRVMPDAISAIQAQGRLAMGMVGAGGVGVPMGQPPIPAVGQPIPQMAGAPGIIGAGQGYQQGIGGRSGLIDIKYDGDLPGLLDMVTNRLGVSWKMVDSGVSIFYTDTRTFRVFVDPVTDDLQSVIQSGTTMTTGVSSGVSGTSGNSGIGGSSGSQQSTIISMKSDLWGDIDASIQGMITPGVGRAKGARATGTYTVTDVPEVLDRIANYIDTENKSLTRQVRFNVKVLAVSLTDSDGLGIDWTLIYKSLSGNWGFRLTNISQPDASSISGAVNVLSTATGRAAQFAGSSAIISALAQQGRVSELSSPTVTTLNYHTVPVQFGKQISFIAGSQTTNTASVGSTTSITLGNLTTGFNMRLRPYVMPDNQMIVDAAVNVASLARLRQVGTAASPAEAPDLDSRIVKQTARLHPGETMILSSFEQINDTSNRSGVGDPSNILLGGSVQSSSGRTVVVILVTPILMD